MLCYPADVWSVWYKCFYNLPFPHVKCRIRSNDLSYVLICSKLESNPRLISHSVLTLWASIDLLTRSTTFSFFNVAQRWIGEDFGAWVSSIAIRTVCGKGGKINDALQKFLEWSINRTRHMLHVTYRIYI